MALAYIPIIASFRKNSRWVSGNVSPSLDSNFRKFGSEFQDIMIRVSENSDLSFRKIWMWAAGNLNLSSDLSFEKFGFAFQRIWTQLSWQIETEIEEINVDLSFGEINADLRSRKFGSELQEFRSEFQEIWIWVSTHADLSFRNLVGDEFQDTGINISRNLRLNLREFISEFLEFCGIHRYDTWSLLSQQSCTRTPLQQNLNFWTLNICHNLSWFGPKLKPKPQSELFWGNLQLPHPCPWEDYRNSDLSFRKIQIWVSWIWIWVSGNLSSWKIWI